MSDRFSDSIESSSDFRTILAIGLVTLASLLLAACEQQSTSEESSDAMPAVEPEIVSAELSGSAAEPSPVIRETASERAWNFERVGTGLTADGQNDLGAYAKLGPWPNPDGNIIYSGCYDPSTLTPHIAGSDRCFATVDISDPLNPVRLATVYTYDRENSPAPPRGHPVWSYFYKFPNLPVQSPCMVDWQDPEIFAGEVAPPCWDPGWNTHTHYIQKGPGNIVGVNQ